MSHTVSASGGSATGPTNERRVDDETKIEENLMTQSSAHPIENLISRPASYRWLQLFIGILCMCMIANLQYGWTLFVNPITEKFGWSKAAIQVAFTIFVLTETWLVPIEGYLVDRFGPRPVVFVGGILCAIGWVWNSMADSLTSFYIAAAISGVGAGAVYGTCVGNALKWFPDRRGLAAGLTAAGFGMGSALTIVPISAIIKASGYQTAFLYFGIGQGLVVLLASLALTDPRHVRSDSPSKKQATRPSRSAAVPQSRVNFEPLQILLDGVGSHAVLPVDEKPDERQPQLACVRDRAIVDENLGVV